MHLQKAASLDPTNSKYIDILVQVEEYLNKQGIIG